MKQIKQAEEKLSKASQPLGYIYVAKDFLDQAQELSDYVQKISLRLRPQDPVGYGQDGAQPLSYESELYALENGIVPSANLHSRKPLFARLVAFIVCLMLGTTVAMFFETLVLLNFDVSQLIDGITSNGLLALVGVYSLTWDPSIPIAFLTGLLAGYVVYLRLLPGLETKVRYGKLLPEPAGHLAELKGNIELRINGIGLFDASKITWMFHQSIVSTMKEVIFSPLEFLYRSSVAGAASMYDQLLVAEDTSSHEYVSAVQRLTGGVRSSKRWQRQFTS